MSRLDQLLTNNTEALNNLPLEKRATIVGGLADELKIKDIATLAYPEDTEKQESFSMVLVSLCKSAELNYYGNIEGWNYWDNMPNWLVSRMDGLKKGVMVLLAITGESDV